MDGDTHEIVTTHIWFLNPFGVKLILAVWVALWCWPHLKQEAPLSRATTTSELHSPGTTWEEHLALWKEGHSIKNMGLEMPKYIVPTPPQPPAPFR